MGQHQLTSGNTLWIFVSCSSDGRHLEDVIFGVATLRKRGVPDERILVFTDHPKVDPHFKPYGIAAHPVDEFEARVRAGPPSEYAIVIVGGHGHIGGLGNAPPPTSATAAVLPPHKLCTALRQLRDLQVGVVVLTQCFGGVYNFVDATTMPPLVVLGATNLNPSLSIKININPPLSQVDGSPGLSSWLANVFSLVFFSWLASPVDIDGDGSLTLMDAYKLAGATSNQLLVNSKVDLFNETRQLETSLQATAAELAAQQKLALAVADSPDPAILSELLRLQILCDAQDQQLKQALQKLYLHQEPWVLHANLAREIHFV